MHIYICILYLNKGLDRHEEVVRGEQRREGARPLRRAWFGAGLMCIHIYIYIYVYIYIYIFMYV